jgi:hypothetical protein
MALIQCKPHTADPTWARKFWPLSFVDNARRGPAAFIEAVLIGLFQLQQSMAHLWFRQRFRCNERPSDPPGQPAIRTEPWRRVLRDAADLLDKHGWCQHATQAKRSGAMCMHGAINKAVTGHAWLDDIASEPWCDATAAVARYLQDQGAHRRSDIAIVLRATTDSKVNAYGLFASWNDAKGRKKREAISALRAAAEQD